MPRKKTKQTPSGYDRTTTSRGGVQLTRRNSPAGREASTRQRSAVRGVLATRKLDGRMSRTQATRSVGNSVNAGSSRRATATYGRMTRRDARQGRFLD